MVIRTFFISAKVTKEPSRHEKDTKQHSHRQERERTYVQEPDSRHSARREKEHGRERSRSAKRSSRSRSGDRKVANVSAQAQPTARDVSVNFPSPIVKSPPTRRKKQVRRILI